MNTYDLTCDGLCVAIFCTKVYDRLLRVSFRRRHACRPVVLRCALATVDRRVQHCITTSRLGNAD